MAIDLAGIVNGRARLVMPSHLTRIDRDATCLLSCLKRSRGKAGTRKRFDTDVAEVRASRARQSRQKIPVGMQICVRLKVRYDDSVDILKDETQSVQWKSGI